MNQNSNELYFLEVQPTYATGFSKVGYCGYFPPFYNPSDPELVKFILQNKSELEQKIPLYYFNWLDKNNHFNEVFKELKDMFGPNTYTNHFSTISFSHRDKNL